MYLLCKGRGDLKLTHYLFIYHFYYYYFSISESSIPINTTPVITYKREMLTRYVVVIEDTKDMLVRVSILYYFFYFFIVGCYLICYYFYFVKYNIFKYAS